MFSPKALPTVHAYRNLYKAGLRAVQYSNPARRILRDSLRIAFRNGSKHDLNDADKITNTLLFLDKAAVKKGMEHRILKNLLMVRYWQRFPGKTGRVLDPRDPRTVHVRQTMYNHFETTLAAFNKSIGTCLK